MNITSINLTLWEERGAPTKVRAFASVVFDYNFVVHDIKIIDGPKGLYVVMPSRKLTDNCPMCKAKTAYLAHYCEQCGYSLASVEERQPVVDERGRYKVFQDVCHPLNAECRAKITDAVMAEYRAKAGQPAAHGGVVCSGMIITSGIVSGMW